MGHIDSNHWLVCLFFQSSMFDVIFNFFLLEFYICLYLLYFVLYLFYIFCDP